MHINWKHIFFGIIFVIVTVASLSGTAQQIVAPRSTAAAMMQADNYRDYESYIDPRLKIKLEYPSDWKILPLNVPLLSNLKGFISFEPLESEQEPQANIREEMPFISIIGEKLKFRNPTLDEFAKVQSENIQYLFLDFDFKLENKTVISVGNKTAIKIVFTIVDHYTHNDPKIRIGMEIWTIRADTIYTISYFGEQNQYSKYLPGVQKIIDSFEFIG